MIAGDLHFYSRYQTLQKDRSKAPDLQLITSGGGGAFAHPTHSCRATCRCIGRCPKTPSTST